MIEKPQNQKTAKRLKTGLVLSRCDLDKILYKSKELQGHST